MLYDSCFPKGTVAGNKLREMGFLEKPDGSWLLQANAKIAGFAISYCIVGNSCRVDVTDLDSGWEYDLFNVPSSGGATVFALRQEVEAFLKRVGRICFGVRQNRVEALDYCRRTYGTEADYPFQDSTAQCVRKPSGKWYGLFMTVDAGRLDPRKKGDVEVLNLKATPERIANVDMEFVFPAWHMNRKHWISVLLDSAIPQNLLHTLIDESYNLVK